MARIALKVDVDTLRGTLEGVPRLVELLKRRGAGATFLFSLFICICKSKKTKKQRLHFGC